MFRRRSVFLFAAIILIAIGLGMRLGVQESAVKTLGEENHGSVEVVAKSVPRAAAQPERSARMPERLPEPASGEKQGSAMLEEWLASSTDSDRVGLTIMQNFFQLPEKDHLSAMQQLVNLVRDFNISGLERILLDPRTSLQAKERLFEDIKIRPEAVKFPIFLKLMQQQNHPQSQDARGIMVNLLGGDFGNDYGRWEKEIERALKE